MENKPILQIQNVTKTYPGVVALDNVSFDVYAGEVHALVGENGAGKSTLIKTLAGAIAPDSGTITLHGKDHNHLTPVIAKQNGVAVIYQEFTLVPSISVAENIFLGEKTSDGLFVDMKERSRKARELFQQFSIDIDPDESIQYLSPAYQQIVEILKAVSKKPKILIFDEPTAPLTVSEVRLLFKIIEMLKRQGVTMIYISHRLEEIFEIADRVTVLRDGTYVGTSPIAEVTRQSLIAQMVGRQLTESYPVRNANVGEEALRVENLSGNGVHDISFSLHRGEILGFAGLVGAGRTELMQVIYGAAPMQEGAIYINGEKAQIKNCRDAIKKGIGLIPEDRKEQGAFLRMSIKWNTAINSLWRICKGIFVDQNKEKALADAYIAKFRIRTPNAEQAVANLSGGNQQKVVLAKTLAAQSHIIIFDEPTRGIDVGAKQEIYQLMNELAENGHAIIIVSSEIPELLGMDAICQKAVERGYGVVCVGNGHVEWVKKKYNGKFLVSTAIDYPIGRSTKAARIFMAEEAARAGADIIDLTMNASLYRTDPAACEEDLREIIQACKKINPNVMIKIIADFVHWNYEERAAVCRMIKRVNPEGIKTHTGYFGGNFQLGDLLLIRDILGPDIIVKAAGCIPDAGTAIAYLNAGLTEIGNAAVNCDAMYDSFDDYIQYFDE